MSYLLSSSVRRMKENGELGKKMLVKGADLEAEIVIRDSVCQSLAISCDHMHSGGLIQLTLKSEIVYCCLVSQLDEPY